MTSLSVKKANFRIKFPTVSYILVSKPIENPFNRVASDRTFEKFAVTMAIIACSPDVPLSAGNAPANCNKPNLNIYYNSTLESFVNN